MVCHGDPRPGLLAGGRKHQTSSFVGIFQITERERGSTKMKQIFFLPSSEDKKSRRIHLIYATAVRNLHVKHYCDDNLGTLNYSVHLHFFFCRSCNWFWNSHFARSSFALCVRAHGSSRRRRIHSAVLSK